MKLQRTLRFKTNSGGKGEEKASSETIVNDSQNKQSTAKLFDRQKEPKGVSIEVCNASPIDMLYVLSQITIKVPLLGILEHKYKAIAWVGSMTERIDHDCNSNQTPKEDEREI